MDSKILTVATYGTVGYLYAFQSMVKRIVTATMHYDAGHFVFATDKSDEGKKAADFLKGELRSGWQAHIIKHDIKDDTSQNYKEEAQKRIAQLEGSALHLARKLKADLFWSVEADVLVPPDALKISEWVLQMPDNYYDIAMVTYPNGAFLGGRGSYRHAIEEDFLPNERNVKPRLMKVWNETEKRISELTRRDKKITTQPEAQVRMQKLKKEQKRMQRIQEKIKRYPPDGNVFEVIGKHGWRKRGWLEHAYPAVGRGAILPTDWVGMGCTLLSKRALELANFDGYGPDFGGTQDLFLVWKKWKPVGLRLAVIPHIVCDHVKHELDFKTKKRTGKINHFIAFHEPEGEHEGHLRISVKPWCEI